MREKEMISDQRGRPFRDLRVSVTDRCNFRCPYCMPAEIYGESYAFLPKAELLTFEEITRLTSILITLGAVKVRLTGGEPLVRKDLHRLVGKLSNLPEIRDLALTTNGYLLSQQAQALRDAGLQRVSVSVDTLDEETFGRMSGRGFGPERVLEGISAAERAGFSSIKINAVVRRGFNDHTIVELARYFRERGHTVRFIEYMDVGNRNGWRMDDVVPADEIVSMIDEVMPVEPIESSYRGEVALRYRYRDGGGEIGIIASVSKPFCGDCTRLRLSPEGKLYTCLFASVGTDLRGALRSHATDEELAAIISGVWNVRQDRYSEERSSMTEDLRKSREKVEMYHIGG